MAPPVNDTFASATSIATSSGSLAGTTFDATDDASDPLGGSGHQTVWYTFSPPTTGWYKFYIPWADHTYHGVFGFDNSKINLRIFPDGAITVMTSGNVITDSNLDTSNQYGVECAAFFTSGSTYRIRIDSIKSSSINNSGTCDYTLRWAQVSPPANDDLANAVDLGSIPVNETGQTVYDATFETSEVKATTLGGSGLDKEQSVWYTFTPSTSGKYRIQLDNVVPLGDHRQQAILQISTQSTLAGYTPANELDRISLSTPGFETGPFSDTVYVDLVGGTTYYIRVSAAYANANSAYSFNGDTFTFDLNIDVTSPPANDDFGSAEALSTSLPNSLTATAYDSTPDAGQSTSFPFSSSADQTIWYTFTPTISGKYIFRIPYSSLVYDGDNSNPLNGELQFAIADAAVIGDVYYPNMYSISNGPIFLSLNSGETEDGVIVADLVSGTTYYLVIILDGTPFNNDSMQFDLEWDAVTPPSNDDFANATAISGASGSEDFDTLGAGAEASEPASAYWNTVVTGQRSVWFDWTCPTTGDYVFKVEATDDNESRTYPNYDLAVWQGGAIGSLTKVTRTWSGSQNLEGRPRSPGTAVGFAAVAGQHYKIQAVCNHVSVTASKLSWRTNTITGDTAAGATSYPDGRTDNYGNSDSDPPPNFDTILSSHDSWWYTDGQVGHVKWFKATYSQDTDVEINGRAFDGLVQGSPNLTVVDMGLIAYKGPSYGSLTVAKQTGGVNDAAMMMGSDFVESELRDAWLIDITGTKVHMVVPVSAGETLWIALFGLYDADYAGSDSEDAQQFEIDLHVPSATPANDVWDDVFDNDDWQYHLNFGQYGPFGSQSYAVHRTGSTVGATADVGEGARAGFAATRSVWYAWFPDWDDETEWTLTVDAAVDCVLGIYDVGFAGTLLELMFEDDDSGAGNNPQITIVPADLFANGWSGNYLAIVVDSKTEGPFDLYLSRAATGTPPANDDLADAEVISSIPFSTTGTTVGATAEFDEPNAEILSFGPKDSVWYKYVATADGTLTIKATCDSGYEDGYIYVDTWKGTSYANLIRGNEPPPNDIRGFFSLGNTPADTNEAALSLDVVNGETYFIRVQTESGGSEDFTLYVDQAAVYIEITPSGSDEMHGTLIDAATVPVTITPSAIEHFSLTTDSATVPIKITVGGNDVKGFEYVDVAIVYVDITIDSHDCLTHFEAAQLIGYCFRKYDAVGAYRWFGTGLMQRFEVIAGDGLEEC